jgi:hypothetical protein
MKFPLKRAPADFEMLESGCFEGERDAEHLVEPFGTGPCFFWRGHPFSRGGESASTATLRAKPAEA